MKEMMRRIRRLEQRLAPQPASKGPSAADILWERIRRFAEAQGEPVPEWPSEPYTDDQGRLLSVAEILRRR